MRIFRTFKLEGFYISVGDGEILRTVNAIVQGNDVVFLVKYF